jgi:hypothetical protein
MRLKYWIIAVVAIILFVIGKHIYKSHIIEEYKTEIIVSLEKYKLINHQYPKNLNETGKELKYNFHYTTDSAFQTFRVSYSYGIMETNTMVYESETKKWVTKFNY